MFDTVHVWAKLVDPGRVLSRLSSVREDRSWRPCLFGWLRPEVRVKVYGDRASVEFEMPTLARSSSPSDVAAVFAGIEEGLGERLDDASISRLDVYADLPLSGPVADYLRLLVWKPKVLPTLHHDEATGALQTVAFSTHVQYLHYYDRVARLKELGRDAEGDVARYEMQLKKVSRALGGRVVPADLSNPALLARCASRWEGQHALVLSPPVVRPFAWPMDARRHASILGLSMQPEAFHAYGAEYDAAKEAGVITAKTRDRKKGQLRDLLRDERYVLPNPLREELDARVAEAAAEMRR